MLLNDFFAAIIAYPAVFSPGGGYCTPRSRGREVILRMLESVLHARYFSLGAPMIVA